MVTLIYLLLGHWFLSLFCQSFFLHRYCSHHMFKMNKTWERVFYFLTYLTQGPSFLNPESYATLHQRHHKHSDKPQDPHSPSNHSSVMHMMMNTYHDYKAILVEQKTRPDHKNEFSWNRLDKFAQSKYNTYLWVIIYCSLYYFLELPWWAYAALPLHFFVGPIQGAIVNWCGHKMGYRNFATKDFSRNTLPIDFALMGELYQNNHHKFGQRLNFAHRWFEIDFTFLVAKVLNFLRIIKMKEA
ncbi:fatty acid desaturase [Bacteriovoracaceae bacterium]|nr:fatty acid desaturase [Bacteriovoracaceae bacterium]